MKFLYHQKLGKPECPYMERWVADFRLFSVRLHHWYFGDDPRHFHDHPWDFWVFVVFGCYVDVNSQGRENMERFSLTFRPAEHKHTVETKGCWTLILTGPEKREWGFWVRNKSNTNDVWFKAKRYFIKHGHHPCE